MTGFQQAQVPSFAASLQRSFRNGWSLLRASFRPDPAQRDLDRILRDLRGLEDYQLNDIGLCRSDLTSEGLTIAAARRRLRQDEAIKDLERAAGYHRKAA